MNACSVCSGPVAQPKTGRRRVYCKNACRQRAYRAALALRNSVPKNACADAASVTKLTPELRAWLRHEINRRKRARIDAAEAA